MTNNQMKANMAFQAHQQAFDKQWNQTNKAIGCFGAVVVAINLILVGMLGWLIYAAIQYLQTH